MDELKTRLEFLEHVSSSSGEDETADFMKQVDELSVALNTLLDKHSEMRDMAENATARKAWSEAIAQENRTDTPPPENIQRQIVESHHGDLVQFADTLESQPSLEIPDVDPAQIRSGTRIPEYSELAQQFDDASVRSARVARTYLGQVADTNAGKSQSNSKLPTLREQNTSKGHNEP